MSDADEPAAPGGLSFERAEFENQREAALSCGYCKKPLSVQYWQIAKRPACADCRGVVEREIEAGKSLKRFLGALQYGALAAAAGCLGWILVSKITAALSGDGRSMQIGFVAIGVGYLVGKAVRKGAGGQGGPRYQVLALFLTYSAIALASLPDVLEVVRSSPNGERASLPGLIFFAYELPFLGGTQNIIGLFIIAIGLYEAWKLTRALPLHVLGPFPIQSDPVELAAPSDATH
ncbi:MAG TPA: hypothetical protein VNW92_13300 [Polyangiaceae bacterium]|jgi:hypothetical protein|nr:hypothetical protein [Polyangiaceae bacterium]